MLRTSILVFSILCAAVLIGCSTTETSNSNSTANNSNKAATTGSSNSGSTAPANNSGSSTTASSGDKVGIPECDDYIAKYEACMGKVPEAARAQYQAGLKTLRDSWKQAAANPTTKAALAQGCKQATETAATSMKSFGCTF